MSYNIPGGRRGRPKRILDPSAGMAPQSTPTNHYVYNHHQQTPIDNGLSPNYGFNLPESGSPINPSYGFNVQTSMPTSYPAAQQTGDIGGFGSAQFAGQILAEPIVSNMAMQYGNALVGSGKEQFEKYVPISVLKYYFAVDTDYVIKKLFLIFFPFTHKDWSITYENDNPLPPRYEKNAPDMYIPTMAFLTFIVMAGMMLGMQDKFSPEKLSITTSSALAWGIVELVIHWITLYVMNLETSLRTLDLLAYSSYKYVGMNTALITSLLFSRWGYYLSLIYVSLSLSFFLMRSLKLRVLPHAHSSYSDMGNKRRLYFILYFALIQPLLMWWLSYHLI